MPVSPTVHAAITSYNAIRQNIANSRLLTERVRAYCEADHQQAMVEASNEYNAMLGTLNAVHLRLDEARENLVARQAEIQVQLRARHKEILRLEHEICAVEQKAPDLLSQARLSPKERQLIVQNPFSILPAAPVYDVPLLERLYDTIYNTLDEFEEQLAKLRHERVWYRQLYRKTQPVLKPGILAVVIAAIYGALYLWESSFFKGKISGIYWLGVFYESTSFIAVISIPILAAFALRRFGGCLICFVAVFAIIFGLVWFLSSGFGESATHLQNVQTNNHTYILASQYFPGDYDDFPPNDDYYLFECDDAGFICSLAANNMWERRYHTKNNLMVVRDSAQHGMLIVRFNDQVLMHIPDCGNNCLPTDGN